MLARPSYSVFMSNSIQTAIQTSRQSVLFNCCILIIEMLQWCSVQAMLTMAEARERDMHAALRDAQTAYETHSSSLASHSPQLAAALQPLQVLLCKSAVPEVMQSGVAATCDMFTCIEVRFLRPVMVAYKDPHGCMRWEKVPLHV
jgi:hypothetical protein